MISPTDRGMAARSGAVREIQGGVVEHNHGISEENVKALLLPVGIAEHQIPSRMIEEFDLLSESRNEVAHRHVGYMTTVPNPRDERRRILRILWGLRKIESELRRLAEE